LAGALRTIDFGTSRQVPGRVVSSKPEGRFLPEPSVGRSWLSSARLGLFSTFWRRVEGGGSDFWHRHERKAFSFCFAKKWMTEGPELELLASEMCRSVAREKKNRDVEGAGDVTSLLHPNPYSYHSFVLSTIIVTGWSSSVNPKSKQHLSYPPPHSIHRHGIVHSKTAGARIVAQVGCFLVIHRRFGFEKVPDDAAATATSTATSADTSRRRTAAPLVGLAAAIRRRDWALPSLLSYDRASRGTQLPRPTLS
jgi:hypothetical protein